MNSVTVRQTTAPRLKGLMYDLQCMDSWLYDGDPMMHLTYQKTFSYLKTVVDEGYFEQLIRDYLLDNPFEAVLVVSPGEESDGKGRREDGQTPGCLQGLAFGGRDRCSRRADQGASGVPGDAVLAGGIKEDSHAFQRRHRQRAGGDYLGGERGRRREGDTSRDVYLGHRLFETVF